MNAIKRFLSVAALAGMTALMGVGSAEAGPCVAKISLLDDYGTFSYVYGTTVPSAGTVTPGTICYCTTTNHDQRGIVAAAATAGTTVKLWGNGTATTGYIGACTWIDVLPLN
jgi:hypothetical protein